jgi:hypothetical protein
MSFSRRDNNESRPPRFTPLIGVGHTTMTLPKLGEGNWWLSKRPPHQKQRKPAKRFPCEQCGVLLPRAAKVMHKGSANCRRTIKVQELLNTGYVKIKQAGHQTALACEVETQVIIDIKNPTYFVPKWFAIALDSMRKQRLPIKCRVPVLYFWQDFPIGQALIVKLSNQRVLGNTSEIPSQFLYALWGGEDLIEHSSVPQPSRFGRRSYLDWVQMVEKLLADTEADLKDVERRLLLCTAIRTRGLLVRVLGRMYKSNTSHANILRREMRESLTNCIRLWREHERQARIPTRICSRAAGNISKDEHRK